MQDLKSKKDEKNNSKRASALFVRVEERLNTRKALEKENVCTFAKCILKKDKKNIQTSKNGYAHLNA